VSSTTVVQDLTVLIGGGGEIEDFIGPKSQWRWNAGGEDHFGSMGAC